MNILNPRGFRIPNCDKKGFYKKKQVQIEKNLHFYSVSMFHSWLICLLNICPALKDYSVKICICFFLLQAELIEIKCPTLVTQTLGLLPPNYSLRSVLLFYISSY